jgi:hypothetical protein
MTVWGEQPAAGQELWLHHEQLALLLAALASANIRCCVLLLYPRALGPTPNRPAAFDDEFNLVWGPERTVRARLDVLANDRNVAWIQGLSPEGQTLGTASITPDARAITYK